MLTRESFSKLLANKTDLTRILNIFNLVLSILVTFYKFTLTVLENK